MLRIFAIVTWVFATNPAHAAQSFSFASIDGGMLSMEDWAGRPILVVNTASRCGFTRQYNGLQELYERYRDQGLVVLAVPSNDFRQELATAEEIKDFCEVNFGLTLPMTEVTPVLGAQAHPFYKWVKQDTGFAPKWNFSKILVAPDGTVAATFGSSTRPLSRTVLDAVQEFLE